MLASLILLLQARNHQLNLSLSTSVCAIRFCSPNLHPQLNSAAELSA